MTHNDAPVRRAPRRLAAAAIVCGTVLFGAGIAAVTPAGASSSECATNEFCLWQNANYDGLLLHRKGVNAAWYNFPSALNDQASSAANLRGTLDSAAARDANGGGGVFCFNGNTWTGWLNDFGSWNDSFTSSKNYSTANVC